MKTLALKRMQAAYLDMGEGTPIIFAHCSSASHKEWASFAARLAVGHRVLVPDFLGYGRSSPWPPKGSAIVDSDLDVLNALIEIAGPNVHLVGHSYGGALCLEAARQDAERAEGLVASLCIVEPVSFHLLNTGHRTEEWREISAVARTVIGACARAEWNKAANAYMGFWLGPMKWRLSPARFRKEVVRTVAKVAHEFGTMFDNSLTPGDYAGIGCPVTLIRGGRSPRPATAVVDILHASMAHAELHDIPSAGHMSPFTHKGCVNGLIEGHLSAVVTLEPRGPQVSAKPGRSERRVQ